MPCVNQQGVAHKQSMWGLQELDCGVFTAVPSMNNLQEARTALKLLLMPSMFLSSR